MKFNVGDKVKIVKGKNDYQSSNTVGVVYEIRSIGSSIYYTVRANHVTDTYSEKDLERI